ncbi:MAG: uracil-DNA glycosylase [Fusobacteriaceae bacterium]|jgi:DNA polymerase|nr:uracil-DNA glycosylase [Fusobacteriaceae bacterium]
MENLDELWEDLLFELKNLKNPLPEIGDDDVIVGSGNKNGKIVFVGDDPGLYENEDLKVQPGSSGEFLYRLCDFEGIEASRYYVTTLTKRKCKYRDYLEKDRETLKELLDMQLSLINPRLIVALGADAANLLFSREMDFAKIRGSVLDLIGNTKILVTYDVGFAQKSRLESGKQSRVAREFWDDMKTLKRELDQIHGIQR